MCLTRRKTNLRRSRRAGSHLSELLSYNTLDFPLLFEEIGDEIRKFSLAPLQLLIGRIEEGWIKLP